MIKEALRQLAALVKFTMAPPDRVAVIRSALEAAQQAAERYAECKRLLLAAQRLYQDQAEELEAAQQEAEAWEAIEAWCRAGDRKRDCTLTPVGDSDYWCGLYHGGRQVWSTRPTIHENINRPEALTIAAAWCRGAGQVTFRGEPCDYESPEHQAQDDREMLQEQSGKRILTFPGGSTTIPKPTRADLILSAQQWVARARDELHDADGFAMNERNERPLRAIESALDHVMRILKELSDAKT